MFCGCEGLSWPSIDADLNICCIFCLISSLHFLCLRVATWRFLVTNMFFAQGK